VAEGMVRMAVSQGMAERSAGLALGSELLAERGAVEVATAAVAGRAAEEMTAEGAAKIAGGSAELGAASATADFAEALADKAS
jgi:hypothetical protein